MTADTLKTTRVLELYQDFLSGKLINKQQAAEQYHVNVRSIQRDIDSIRDFLSEQCAKEGIVRKIEYDKKENGYRLVTQEIERLSKGEVLALCKILLESRAFTKEQVEKQLQIILNLCVSQKEKSDIEWFISNELFHYQNPAHAAVDPDNLWMVAQAIRNQSVLEIKYQKLKDRQIVKRSVEPVGLMFSEYYFYLMAVITDHSTREAFHKKNDPYPTITGLIGYIPSRKQAKSSLFLIKTASKRASTRTALSSCSAESRRKSVSTTMGPRWKLFWTSFPWQKS